MTGTSTGNFLWQKTTDKIDSKYKIRDIDDSSQTTYTYFGKQTASGAYQIMRLTNATNAFEYAYWTSDYATAWTGRVALTYGNVQ